MAAGAHIGVNAINEALRATNTDALQVGRPIHQTIATNGQIDSAFDHITYGKGGQVVAMNLRRSSTEGCENIRRVPDSTSPFTAAGSLRNGAFRG